MPAGYDWVYAAALRNDSGPEVGFWETLGVSVETSVETSVSVFSRRTPAVSPFRQDKSEASALAQGLRSGGRRLRLHADV